MLSKYDTFPCFKRLYSGSGIAQTLGDIFRRASYIRVPGRHDERRDLSFMSRGSSLCALEGGTMTLMAPSRISLKKASE